MFPRTTIAALFAALAMLLAACGSDESAASGQAPSTASTTQAAEAPSFPVTVTAGNGEITIEEEPTAIVSLSPSITEMLYAVGAGDQVTAVDTSSNHPPGAPVTDLSGFRPNVEAIGALQPDLVFLARDRDNVVATLEGVGIPVVLLESAESLDDVLMQIETVGAATGHTAEAERVAADVAADIERLVAQVPERDEPLTYFYELTGEYHTLTSDTFVGAVLDLAGLQNIADGADPAAGRYPQLTAEYVLDADPDVVFIAHSDGSVPSEDELAARPGWAGLAAVRQGAVVPLNPDLASRWGPRVVELFATVLEATGDLG